MIGTRPGALFACHPTALGIMGALFVASRLLIPVAPRTTLRVQIRYRSSAAPSASSSPQNLAGESPMAGYPLTTCFSASSPVARKKQKGLAFHYFPLPLEVTRLDKVPMKHHRASSYPQAAILMTFFHVLFPSINFFLSKPGALRLPTLHSLPCLTCLFIIVLRQNVWQVLRPQDAQHIVSGSTESK